MKALGCVLLQDESMSRNAQFSEDQFHSLVEKPKERSEEDWVLADKQEDSRKKENVSEKRK